MTTDILQYTAIRFQKYMLDSTWEVTSQKSIKSELNSHDGLGHAVQGAVGIKVTKGRRISVYKQLTASRGRQAKFDYYCLNAPRQ